MKYKVGDKVRVRSDLVANGDYGGWRFEAEMIDKKGMILTVDSIDSDDYYIMDDGSEYWTDEMLEDVEEEFRLPEKWHIKLTSENKASIDAWRTCGVMISCAGYILSDYNGKKGFLIVDKRNIPEGYEKEITFDQFKKYVLKESEPTPVKENKIVWLNGRWYRILNNWWGKFETIHNSGKRIKFSESITASGKYDATPKNIDLISEIELLTDLSEIQQYLPENHPDKLKKRTKKVEDLKYPDVVHCNSQKERNLLNNHVLKFDINYWTSEAPYLLIGGGCYSHPYEENTLSNYVNYEFSDIIFPEEKDVKEWSVGSYAVLLNNYMGIDKGTVSRIDCDYGHGITISHTIDNGDPANLSKNSECKWFSTIKEAQAFSNELLGKNKVETKPKLSKEELLAEAKRRYPVGTKYKTASNDSSDIFVLSSNNWGDNLLDDVVHAECGKGCLYYKGDWAEIISKPTVEQHSKYVECIGLEEVDIMFWRQGFTVGEIYLVEEDDGTTSFRINGMWCDKSQFKPSTKEAFDKQGESGVKKKEELVQTEMSQRQACDSCKYINNCGTKGFSCKATGGQHYPKDNSSERYIVTADPFDFESSSDGIEVGKFPLDRGLGFYEQMEKLHMQAYYPMGPIRGLYKLPIEPKDCFESDEIYVPIIKTEVKQIKL